MAEIKFKVYIGTIFFSLSFFLLVAVFGTLAVTLQSRLFEETVDRLYSTAVLGSQGLNTADLKTLLRQMGPGHSPEADQAVEKSPPYLRISNALNRIRDSNPELILYAYILAPQMELDKARFVVDADVLKLRALEASEGKTQEEISGFNRLYNINDQPTTRAALAQRIPLVEKQFIWDEEYRVNSLMGFAPIFDQDSGEFLAVLGIDISDVNYREFLFQVFFLAVALSIFLLLGLILLSIWIAGHISRPIMDLTDSVRRFGQQDLSSRVALNTGIKELYDLKTNYNSMADRIQEYSQHLVNLNRSLERFVPVEFLNHLSRENLTQVELGDQVQRDMAVLFSDIRGFTTIAEHMSPKQTFNLLNTYLSRVAPRIRSNQGFIDKYLGDGLMAIFPRRVDDALAAAVDMLRELKTYNQERIAASQQPILTGTGIHMGTLMMGTIGEEARMQTTVIADSVNMASRIEGLTKEMGASILISKAVYDRLEDPEKYLLRFAGYAQLKGKDLKVPIFEVFETDEGPLRQQKAATRTEFEKAVNRVNEGKLKDALVLLKNLEAQTPQDRGVQYYLKVCQSQSECL